MIDVLHPPSRYLCFSWPFLGNLLGAYKITLLREMVRSAIDRTFFCKLSLLDFGRFDKLLNTHHKSNMNRFQCSECHDDAVKSHLFKFSRNLRLTCGGCKGCFCRDFQIFSEKDKRCDHCSVIWCLPGVTPESVAFGNCISILDVALADILDPQHVIFSKLDSFW